jgi:hypothetical protein
VRWMQYLLHSALLNSELGLGFPWLHHIPSLAVLNNGFGLASIADEAKACGSL